MKNHSCITVIIACALCFGCKGPLTHERSESNMEQKSVEVLKLSLVGWLMNSPQEELRTRAGGAGDGLVVGEAEKARFGSWFYDEGNPPLTKYKPPANGPGFDF